MSPRKEEEEEEVVVVHEGKGGGDDAARDRHRQVKSWTKSFSIFDQRFVFVPVVKDLHWSVAVICNPGALYRSFIARDTTETVVMNADTDAVTTGDIGTGRQAEDARVEEENTDKEKDSAGILLMDSLESHDAAEVCTVLREYLNCEAEAQLMKAGNTPSSGRREPPTAQTTPPLLPKPFTMDSMPTVKPDVPRQTNKWDCGVFVLGYCDAVLDRAADFPTGTPMEDLRGMLGTDIFDPQEDIAARRRNLLRLVQDMSAQSDDRSNREPQRGASKAAGAATTTRARTTAGSTAETDAPEAATREVAKKIPLGTLSCKKRPRAADYFGNTGPVDTRNASQPKNAKGEVTNQGHSRVDTAVTITTRRRYPERVLRLLEGPPNPPGESPTTDLTTAGRDRKSVV
jgi:hypothetical protein